MAHFCSDAPPGEGPGSGKLLVLAVGSCEVASWRRPVAHRCGRCIRVARPNVRPCGMAIR
eukprot:364072-Chlamydomonas_euryale.AAC.16